MGKGGGALSAWLKEFTALVFTQTIQAFIYAIIICVILFGMNNTTGVSEVDNNSALGLMATFALLSVFKVEELTKKIFGIQDTKASPHGAMKSLAHTAIALQMGKRVLNNTGKFLGGVRKITQSRQDNAKAKSRLEEDMKDNGYDKDGNPIRGTNKSTAASRVGARAGISAEQEEYRKKAVAAKANGDMDGYRYNMGIAVGMGKSGGGGSGTGGDVSVNSYNDGGISDSDKRRIKNALRTYEDKVSEIKKSRNEGIKDIASSITESVGATFGGTAGAILGGSDGNLDEAITGILKGMGAGDYVGQQMVDSVDTAVKFVQRNHNRKAGISNKQLKQTLDKYKDAIEKENVRYGGSVSIDDM